MIGASWIDQEKRKPSNQITGCGDVENSKGPFKKASNHEGVFIASLSTPDSGKILDDIVLN